MFRYLAVLFQLYDYLFRFLGCKASMIVDHVVEGRPVLGGGLVGQGAVAAAIGAPD